MPDYELNDDQFTINVPVKINASIEADEYIGIPTDGDIAAIQAEVDQLQIDVADIPHLIDEVHDDLLAHEALTTAHSAASAATASRLVVRDASGRAKFAAPSASDDVAIKSTVDTVATDLLTHAALQTAHGAVSAATPSKMMVRDASGRAAVAAPSASGDCANKSYVDTQDQLLMLVKAKAASIAGGTVKTGYVIDSITCVAGDLVLVKDQADATDNGIYQIPVGGGAWSRWTGWDTSTPAIVYVGYGTFIGTLTPSQETALFCCNGKEGDNTIHFIRMTQHRGSTSVTISAKGVVQVAAAYPSTITLTESQVTNLTSDLAAGVAATAAVASDLDVAEATIVSHTSSIATNTSDIATHAALTSPHSATAAATASRLIVRDASGRAAVVDPSASGDIATKNYVDTADSTHAALTSPHSATSAATASRLVVRDASGRAKFAAPSASDDVALKSNVDTVASDLTTHAALTTAHGAVSTATASKIIVRDASGRAAVADPSASGDIANKSYVDTGLAAKQDTLTAGLFLEIVDDTINITSDLIDAIGDTFITPLDERVTTLETSSYWQGLVPLTGRKVVTGYKSTTSAATAEDIGTVPSGKRWAIKGGTFNNTNASTNGIQLGFKRGGTSYLFSSASSSVSQNTTATLAVGSGIVLEAGDTLQVTSTVSGANVWVDITEFDNTCGLKTIFLLTMASTSAQTIYTAPTNGAIILDGDLSVGNPFGTTGLSYSGGLVYFNVSGGNRSVSMNLVPSGGSVGSTNRFYIQASQASSAVTRIVGQMRGTMGSGDFITFTTDATTATQYVYLNIAELP